MIAIKDMEMPKSCEDCQMSSCKGLSGHFYCDITICDVDIEGIERDADCPLVEIVTCKDCKHKKGHGCHNFRHIINEDFFCGDGKRRE